jgi:hypothetical protein
MNIYDCLEEALQHLTDANEIICNADLQDVAIVALLEELQSALDSLQH